MKLNIKRCKKEDRTKSDKIVPKKQRFRRNNQQLKGLRNYSCQNCGKAYASTSALLYHKKLKHQDNDGQFLAAMILLQIAYQK